MEDTSTTTLPRHGGSSTSAHSARTDRTRPRGCGTIAPPTDRPAATVLRSPSTNHPRIHRLDHGTFDSTGVLTPACASADSRRDAIEAAQVRNPQYRVTSAAITCEKPRCHDDNTSTDTTDGSAEPPDLPEPPCP
jgi:hypothetical protein